jgi:hypothetical protein
MKRFFASFVLAILALTSMPLQVLAADTATTGAWTWTDISDYVSARSNRPIWAMAHVNSGWFYTDGINMWNGGQVYRFDGNTNVTVTNEVRNAGLDRVDDIVSDGADTILFLQDVVRTDNQFRIVVNKNGTYYNATDIVRGMLYSNEGISSINAYNGTWFLITTQSRLFKWYANTSAPVQITIPSGITQYSLPSAQSMIYDVNHAAFRGMKIVPVSGSNWLLMAQAQGNWSTYLYNGSTFTSITSTIFPNTRGTDILVGNGTTALYAEGTYAYQNGTLTQYDGSNIRHTTIPSGSLTAPIITSAWDGTSWILISGNKDIVRVLPYTNTAENIGASRDYFITASGDNNGHLLVGGTVSQIGTNGPTYPLTAKLVSITENGASAITNNNSNNSGNAVTDGASGIKTWEWIDPNTNTLANGAQTTYHIGSWDGDGIKTAEIYVNGSLSRTCTLGNATGNTDCTQTIYASNYSAGTSIFVNAKVTDAKNHTAWSTGMTITRTADNNSNNNSNNSNTSNSTIWTWVDPNKTSFNSDENVTFYAGAWDNDGINQIILSVNGSDVRTCSFSNATGNVQCATTLYGSNYSANSTLTLRARMIDKNGVTVWSDTQSIYRNGTGSSNSNNSNSNIWTWIEPNKTSLYADESVSFAAGAWDNDGINQIILSVNGSDVRTCGFNASTGNVQCSTTIYGGNYSSNSTITLRARMVDINGVTTWSNSQSIYRNSGNASNSNSNSNSNGSGGSTWIWLEPGLSSINQDQTIDLNAGAWDGDGVNQITLYVNGSEKKTCNFGGSTSNVECVYTVRANDYSANTNLVLRSRMTDADGNTVWSDEQDVYRNADGSSNNNSGSSNSTISKWEWIEPDNASLQIQNTAAYHADAWSASAIKSIVVYVNGSVSKTCSFNRTVSNRDCAIAITGRNYAQGTSLFVNALVEDYDGAQVWTTGKTIQIVGDGSSNQNNNSNGWVSATTNREGGFTSGQTVTVSVTSDDTDGVARTEIYVNGVRSATCANSKTCSITVTPPSNSNYFNYAGTMIDKNGTVVTTGYKQLIRK